MKNYRYVGDVSHITQGRGGRRHQCYNAARRRCCKCCDHASRRWWSCQWRSCNVTHGVLRAYGQWISPAAMLHYNAQVFSAWWSGSCELDGDTFDDDDMLRLLLRVSRGQRRMKQRPDWCVESRSKRHCVDPSNRNEGRIRQFATRLISWRNQSVDA